MNRKLSSAELEERLAAADNAPEEDSEVAEMRQMFAAMRENSAIAAERQHGLAARAQQQRRRSPRVPRLAWGLATAALAFSVALPVEMHHRSRQKAQEETRQREEAARVQQMQTADEALLMDVSSDLSSTVPGPLQPLSVKFVSTATTNTKGTYQ